MADRGRDNGDGRPVVGVVDAVGVVQVKVRVNDLVAAEADMEDLLRELQLTLIAYPRPEDAPAGLRVLWLSAWRLDAAATDFAEARHQIRAQALLAAAGRGEASITLRLRLTRDTAPAARAYLAAIEDLQRALAAAHAAADTGSDTGTDPGTDTADTGLGAGIGTVGDVALDTAADRPYLESLEEHLHPQADTRRAYLQAIIEQLGPTVACLNDTACSPDLNPNVRQASGGGARYTREAGVRE